MIMPVTQTRVKICGMTSVVQAQAAVAAGADAIGLVFYARSPRNLSLALAKQIAQAMPAFVTVVALFRNAPVGLVRQVCSQVQPDMLQFHGDESAQFCQQFQRPWLKALGMDDLAGPAEVLAAAAEFKNARGLLLDSHSATKAGGSGQAFDWSLVPDSMRGRFILAGGLDADNVGAALSALRPWAVDVSSGVESAPGIKSASKMAAFMAAVAAADRASGVNLKEY